MSQIRRIAISTGGGDCPGLNAVIRAAVKNAVLNHKWEVVGIHDGFDGLIRPSPQTLTPLTMETVSGILPRGGTILGTTNRGNPFAYKLVENGQEVVRDISAQVIENAAKAGIDAIIAIGGDGSQKIALDLFKKGLKLVGVPKTIDNDLDATDVTFGFDTALHTATDAIDKLHTTAESHHRVMVVEVMGRDAGWIALEAGIAGAAHVILLPEIPFTMQKVCDYILHRSAAGKPFSIVVVAEGVNPPKDLEEKYAQEKRIYRGGGAAGNLVGDAIGMITKRETRVTVLGHIQRGGSPSPFDRILSTRFGVEAVEMIARGEFGRIVVLKDGRIQNVPIEMAVGRMKGVSPDDEMVRIAKMIGICFGD